jgi:hypothetical protein
MDSQRQDFAGSIARIVGKLTHTAISTPTQKEPKQRALNRTASYNSVRQPNSVVAAHLVSERELATMMERFGCRTQRLMSLQQERPQEGSLSRWRVACSALRFCYLSDSDWEGQGGTGSLTRSRFGCRTGFDIQDDDHGSPQVVSLPGKASTKRYRVRLGYVSYSE